MTWDTLKAICESNAYDRQRGEPLYSLEVSDAQLGDLETALRARLRCGFDLNLQESGAFCLFAAKTFCREHRGGAWSWDVVLERLGLDGFPQSFYVCLEHGLEVFWGRSVLRSSRRRQFLTTLACEGGLPLQLLRSPTSNLAKYFSLLLDACETFLEVAPQELARRYGPRHLPVTLQDDVVYALSGRLLESIVELRSGLPEGVEPLEWLDAHHSGWRRSLPLELADDVAAQLLRGLLQQPRAKSASPAEAELVRVEAWLDREELALSRIVRVPTLTSGASLREQLGVDSLPTSLRLMLEDTTGVRYELGRFLKSATKDEYSCEASTLEPFTKSAALCEHLKLVAIQGASHVAAPVDVPGGGSWSDLPWVFGPRGDGWVFLGAGGRRSQHDTLLVAVKEGVEWEAVGGASVRSVGELTLFQRQVLEVTGELEVNDQGDCVRVVTGAAEESGQVLQVVGERVELGPGGSAVFAGPPKVRRMGVAGWQWEHGALEFCPVGGRWSALSDRSAGDGFVRLRRDGEVLLRERVCLLPGQARCQVQPALERGRGTLRLEHVQLLAAALSEDVGGVRLDVRPEPGGTRLEFSVAEGTDAPAVVEGRLLFAEGEARVRLGVPVQQQTFVGPAGRLLRNRQLVTLDQLRGIRARVIPLPGPQRPYDVVARARGFVVTLGRLARAADGSLELGLDPFLDMVRSLLGRSDELDETLTLELSGEGQAPTEASELRVQHWDMKFERPEKITDGRLISSLGGAIADLRVEARPLEQPLADPDVLERKGAEVWSFPEVGRAPGPWLITGWVGERLRVRPQLVTVRGEDTAEWSPLGQALRTGDAAKRRKMLKICLEALSDDLEREDWTLLFDVLKVLPSYPPASFDLLRELVRHPDTLAVALLMLAYDEVFAVAWRRLEDLPLLWGLVPLSSWLRAGERVVRSHERACELAPGLTVEGLSGPLLKRFFQRLQRLLPTASWLQLAFSERVPHSPSPGPSYGWALDEERKAMVAPILQGRLGELRQALLRAQSESPYWPTAKWSELVQGSGVDAEVLEPYRLGVEHGYQQAVMNAPLVAAGCFVFGGRPSEDLILRLRWLRAFDEAWFDQAQSEFVGLLVCDHPEVKLGN